MMITKNQANDLTKQKDQLIQKELFKSAICSIGWIGFFCFIIYFMYQFHLNYVLPQVHNPGVDFGIFYGLVGAILFFVCYNNMRYYYEWYKYNKYLIEKQYNGIMNYDATVRKAFWEAYKLEFLDLDDEEE